jgi:hypothetical protein
MKVRIAVCCLLLSLGIATVAMASPNPMVASILDGQLTGVERELVPAAEAMPADKYTFAPSQGEFKGVRNFGSQIKHIAAVNYMIGAAILGTKPPAEMGEGEDGPANVKSKDEIMKYLKDSFTYLHKAMAVIANSHPFDHYGQLVEYLRMNGIIPPASRS